MTNIDSINEQTSSSFLTKKRKLYTHITWDLEEEYLFFELHLIYGNKWKKYKTFLPNK